MAITPIFPPKRTQKKSKSENKHNRLNSHYQSPEFQQKHFVLYWYKKYMSYGEKTNARIWMYVRII